MSQQSDISEIVGHLCSMHLLAIHLKDQINDGHAEGVSGGWSDVAIAWGMNAEDMIGDIESRLLLLIRAARALEAS